MGILITLAVTALELTGALTLVYLLRLAFNTVIDWIRKKGEKANKDEVGFVLKDKLKNGNYKVIKGVFNTKNENIIDYEGNEVKEIDDEFKRQKDLLIFE